jgi:hypothetical protein
LEDEQLDTRKLKNTINLVLGVAEKIEDLVATNLPKKSVGRI